MKKISISHEVPRCLLEESRYFNNFDYCLPHLMDQDEVYKNFFLESKKQGRHIMLDNSLHELSYPYAEDRLHYWLKKLQPQEFFVPDYWEDKTQSIVSARKWITHQKEYPNTTFIAVVQAKTFGDAAVCYQTYKDLGYRKIAFSYGANYYNELCPHSNQTLGKSIGRIYVITKLHDLGFINNNDRVHLLGCSSPQEFGWYRDCSYIESIDTSSPIMATIDGLKYTESGLGIKPKSNMNSCFDISLDKIDLYLLNHNISMFKKINNL